MPWLQLAIETHDQQASSTEDLLLGAGAVSVTLQEHIPDGAKEQAILEPGLGETPLWHNTKVIGLFPAEVDTKTIDTLITQQLLPNNPEHKINFHWQPIEDKDWTREWMQNYHPIQCSKNLWICPSWITPPDPSAVNLLLDPGLAFGTGTHPTTFLCLQWLARQRLSGTHVIDYGCGSGILGVAALLLGAEQASGIDIDPQALLATQDNVRRNHIEQRRFNVYQPQDFSEQNADIILANILAAPLVDLAETMIALLKPNGKLCLSGVLAKQAGQVIAAYSQAIDFDPIQQKEEWVCLSGQRHAKHSADVPQ